MIPQYMFDFSDDPLYVTESNIYEFISYHDLQFYTPIPLKYYVNKRKSKN